MGEVLEYMKRGFILGRCANRLEGVMWTYARAPLLSISRL